jgi:hypothetical protein
MQRRFYLLAFALIALLIPGRNAWGALSSYLFTVTTGTATTMTSATTIRSGGYGGARYTSGNNSATSGAINIGFNFVFDGATYSQVTVSTSGVIGFGSSAVTSTTANNLTGAGSVPIIAPYWDALSVTGGCGGAYSPRISYLSTGTAGNRVFTVEYNKVEFTQYYENMGSFQVRLYEADNSLEFYYGDMSPCGSCWGAGCVSTSGTIGMANGSTNFVSVTPTGSTSATISSSTANNSFNLNSSNRPGTGTIYRFRACGLTIAGNTAQGGTTAMATGDTLLKNMVVYRGNPASYQPFTLSNTFVGCTPPFYSYTLSGPNAADYQISPTGGTLATNTTTTPVLTFTPSGLGKRSATLTVADNYGFNRSYPLAAVGTTRIEWLGDTAQGGTLQMNSGDTLMRFIRVIRRGSGTFTPLTIRNFGTNPTAPLAPITYVINDPTGQYSVSPSSAAIGSLQTSTPVITFTPTGVGPQTAYLVATAEGETRTFMLYAFSAAPGGTFTVGAQQITPETGMFINQEGCVGEYANTQALTIRNIGVFDFTVDQIDFYLTDTAYGQGVPKYPLRRDQSGNPIRSRDYFITAQPGVAPSSANQMPQLPIVIPERGSVTYYITYVGQYPGKRFARAFIRTNGQNFLGTDLNGVAVEGLLNFDLFGRGTGASLSDKATGGAPKAVNFPDRYAGDSVDVTFSLFNTGICDLKISKTHLRIFSGDVNEFKLISIFPGVTVSGDNYVLAPGASGAITARFLPTRSGARRATIWVRTNDSTLGIQGVTARGDFYLDLTGNGKAGIDFDDVVFPAAIIDAESAKAEALVVNSSKEILTITNLAITGPDAAEFAEDAAKPWPARPKLLLAGEELHLAMVHTPATGSQPGPRQATLQVTLSNGEQRSIGMSGRALTRTVTATLQRPFGTVSVGQAQRRTVEIRNTGWAPLTLQAPTLSGPDAAEFQFGTLPRLVLDSGQVEYLEVTYLPSRQGTVSATLNVLSNGTNGAQTVSLSAKGVVTSRDGSDDDASAMQGDGGTSDWLRDTPQTGTSEVGAVTLPGVMELRQSVPNPVSGEATISYDLARSGAVVLRLYDERGMEVMVLEQGERAAGEHMVRVDVSGLASGVYHYRLEVGGKTLSRLLRVVR